MSDQISTLDGAPTEAPATPAPSKRARKSSAAATLLQAAALAAVLVPLGSVAAEASTCTFDGSGSPTCGIVGAGADGFGFFGFSDPGYKVALGFDTVIGEFEVTINAFERTEEEMLAKLVGTPFEGFRPVPIGSNPAAPFIEFQVIAPPPCVITDTEDCSTATNTWISEGPRGPGAIQGYDLRFYWTALTDAEFPDPHVLHDTGPSPTDGLFDIDMTDPNFPYTTEVPCAVFNTCGIELLKAPGDPAVGGRDDMFDTFTLADPTSPVPEPASLVLLGTGIGGLLYRRRRRK